ncbi:MAG: serine--tRNA ligase [Capsulimonas sp.]|jgi:seryl-tRNA synthetase|uniref:serine--tRNA ligase n=1 Tax=Capsulimonas sp. TaxID=2494211 RepID=UPI0032638731|nr:seryl-tRNA synthase [Capsulimonas sp.]
MLDIKLLRTDPDGVKTRLLARNADPTAVDGVLEIDAQLRANKTEGEQLQADLNSSSKSIGALMKDKKFEEAEAAKAHTRELGDQIAVLAESRRPLEEDLDAKLFLIPNLPHETTPPGDEENFQITKTVGEPRKFDFEPKAHWDLATDLGIIDFARGTKLSGSGFVLYKGIGARLERGLVQFMLDLHQDKHGYTEWATPFFLSRESMKASCHLAKFTPEMYHDAEDDLFALPTAEPALINIHRDEILDGRDLPLKYVAYSPCWRREAGAAGKDTRGLLRVHQFDKVEMVKYTLPETSYDEMESLLTDATDVLDALGLPYRIKLLAGGDISFAATKCYDVEAYAPGVDSWLEVSSCSNCEDFQSRQGSIRFRREPGAKPEFPHLLNCSGTALPRVLAALLETYQEADGSVRIPEVLQPYLGGLSVLTKG